MISQSGKGWSRVKSRVSKSCNHAITQMRKIFENKRKCWTNERKTGKTGINFMSWSAFYKVFLVLHVFWLRKQICFYNCAKYLRICANVGLMNARQEKLVLISCLGQYFYKVMLVLHVFMEFLTRVSAQNFQSEYFDCATEFAFRKSGEKMGSTEILPSTSTSKIPHTGDTNSLDRCG